MFQVRRTKDGERVRAINGKSGLACWILRLKVLFCLSENYILKKNPHANIDLTKKYIREKKKSKTEMTDVVFSKLKKPYIFNILRVLI